MTLTDLLIDPKSTHLWSSGGIAYAIDTFYLDDSADNMKCRLDSRNNPKNSSSPTKGRRFGGVFGVDGG
jgi:hypothetical protein